MTGVSHMHDTWHSTATEFRAVVFNLSGDPGRNMSFMSQVWPQWDINDNFGSHSRVTAQCWYFPISGQTPVGTRGTSHCATWAQTAEKELWERQQDTRTNQGTVKDRPVDTEVLRCSGIQKGKWLSMSSWRGTAGRLLRISSKTWQWGWSGGQLESLVWAQQVGTAALGHPELALSLLASKGQ